MAVTRVGNTGLTLPSPGRQVQRDLRRQRAAGHTGRIVSLPLVNPRESPLAPGGAHRVVGPAVHAALAQW